MLHILAADTLPIDVVSRSLQPKMLQQARELYHNDKAQIQHSTSDYASITVEDIPNRPAQVVVRAGANGQISVTCSCRGPYGWSYCKHVMAALLTLHEYLLNNPPSLWRAVLAQTIRKPAAARRNSGGAALVFSLQQRGQSWAITPYTLAARSLPADHSGDPDTLAAAIEERNLKGEVRTIRGQINPESYHGMPYEAITAATMAISGGAYYGYWYGSNSSFAAILRLLERCLVYYGAEHEPLQRRLQVRSDQARASIALRRDGEDVAVDAALVVGGSRIELEPTNAHIVVRDPTWMLIGSELVAIDADPTAIATLSEHPHLRIPAAEQSEFFEKYLLPLTESIAVEGDLLRWEDVSAIPAPRLYLSDHTDGLRAELRFVYGEYELAYEKGLPTSSTRRNVDNSTLARIARLPDAEQQAWEQLSAFGLKRGTRPDEFLLRRNVHPLDFLLHQIPKLAEAGFTVFGEEALTVARVNRHKPTIHFNVSSGIDWFDLEAFVQYGEQTVAIKELRKAVRRREKYLKLADGSIGMIPEEWLERYRHLFALAEERDSGLRINAHQVALIDQVLAGADHAQTDDTYRERLDSLRRFEQIEPQPLPAGLTGILRPYQKSGYDWLHFLHSYRFGGILADDMGVGKCVAPDTRIFINGTLQTAAAIWEHYAGPIDCDGEGAWATPLAPLIVNALSETSGQIVPARVRRLYRQHVSEQLRTVWLEDGSSITITRRHKLLGHNGWTHALRAGDYICVPAHLVWQGATVDQALLVLLAEHIAKGSEATDTSIPDVIMRADDRSINLFLRYLFNAEGSVTSSNGHIEFNSASQVLMHQVTMLLRRLGIWMRISPRQTCDTSAGHVLRTSYNGLISGSSARRFCGHIGFGDQADQARPESACALPQLAALHVDGCPPTPDDQFIHSYIAADLYPSGTFERSSAVWRQSAATCAEVHYCRIVAVEEQRYEGWVYDLEVEQHHNFVAEHMLCHNTIQTLSFLLSLRERQPERPADLIVMPRSLLFNWQRESQQFAPTLRTYIHADQGRISDPAEFGRHDLIFTTYGVLLRDIELLRQYQFYYAVLDEAQAVKNPLAETSRAVRTLNASHRLTLTGTPVENSAAELWSQFAFLNPGLLGNLDFFREEFVGAIERKQDEQSAELLRKMVFPFILRRTKAQVASDLPPRTEELQLVDMEPSQRKLYAKTRDQYRAMLMGLIDNGGMDDARMKVLEGLLRLRQICNHPRLVEANFRGRSGKFDLLLETLETLQAEGHKALIFSQFVQMLALIREALDTRSVPYAYLDGATRNRQKEVDRFQNDASLPFFLISLKAGGVGLNLTAADYVIHVDPWWNPAVEMQATDRTHRIGQTRPVFVYKLITRDSVEEKILLLQERKRALVAQLIAADSGVLKSLTRDDVDVLFS